jgi:hypothetical protein
LSASEEELEFISMEDIRYEMLYLCEDLNRIYENLERMMKSLEYLLAKGPKSQNLP